MKFTKSMVASQILFRSCGAKILVNLSRSIIRMATSSFEQKSRIIDNLLKINTISR
jgi:hypothetical protein